MERAGLDPMRIIAWFEARSLEARADLPITATTIDTIVSHLGAAGISLQLIETQRDNIRAFSRSLIMMARLEHRFSIE